MRPWLSFRVGSVSKEPTQVSVPVEQEVPGEPEVLGLLVLDLGEPVRGELVDPGVRVGQQNGRVRGDDELASIAPRKPVKLGQERELALGR